VPAEHRFLGLDKRSFPYALFVVAVFLVATVVIPRIDDAISWDDPVQAGDQLALADDVVLTPAVGWNVESGFRVASDGSIGQAGAVTLVDDGVTFSVVPGPFDGTPAQLLDQVQKVTSSTDDPSFKVDGEPATLTTPSGEVGVIQSYSSVDGDGLVAAFVIDGTGLKITAYGSPAQMTSASSDIDAMLASIKQVDEEQS
jgi:hypothetical protein